jgi:hypothetical protein
MIVTGPDFPRSSINVILSQPEKQEAVRGFFDTVDRTWEQARSNGLLIDTVQNNPVPHYPALITENGLLVELHSTERRVGPGPNNDTVITGSDVATAALHLIGYDTKIKASLTDLSLDGSNFVTLSMFNAARWNRLNAVTEPGRMYARGTGTLMMFGHQDSAPIKDPQTALVRISEATTGLAGEEASLANTQAMLELAEQGTYLLVVNFYNYRDHPTARLASTGGIKSEAFPTVRNRIGFEL